MTPAIEVRNVEKIFRQSTGMFSAPRMVRAVDGVSFAVPQGGCFGIVGESGCGKSTLARLILGLHPATGGDILVDGRALSAMPRRERAKLIQPVFQDPFSSLNPRRRVVDIVGMPLVAQGVADAERRSRVSEMLARVGLTAEQGQRLPAQLSGGQRQRVAIARALVVRPSIVVCDEPTSALDSRTGQQVMELLTSFARDPRRCVIVVSHDPRIYRYADRMAEMEDGRITRVLATPAAIAAAHPSI